MESNNRMSRNYYIYSMDHYDAFTSLTVGTFAAVTSLLFILLNVYFKSARRFPSIMLTIISLGEFLLSLHWTFSGIHSKFIWGTRKIEKDSWFCFFNSGLSFLGTIIQFVFQIFFTLAIIIMFRNALTKFKYQNWLIIIPSVIIVLSTGFYLFFQSPSIDIYGVCVPSQSIFSTIFATVSFLAVYAILVVITLVHLKRFKDQTHKQLTIKNSSEFYVFYKKYTLFMLLYYVINSFSRIFETIFRRLETSNEGEYSDGYMRLYFLCRLINNFKIYLPIISFMLRISDPYLRNIIKQFLKKKFDRKIISFEDSTTMIFNETTIINQPSFSFTVDSKDIFLNRTLNRIKIKCTKTILKSLEVYFKIIFKQLLKVQEADHFYSDNLKIRLQGLFQINRQYENKSMFAGQNFPKMSKPNDNSNIFTSRLSKSMKPCNLNEDSNNLFEDIEESKNKNQRPTFGKPKKYSEHDELDNLVNINLLNFENSIDLNLFPEFLGGYLSIRFAKNFMEIIKKREYHKQNIEKAFNPELNRECIRKTGNTKDQNTKNGGASGEFFFFTYDRRFIIKTITKKESRVFADIIDDYSRHLVNHGDSFIGRIIGLFSFDFDILEKGIQIVVMENIFKLNPKCIKRKYDLKGSTHSRKVLRTSKLNELAFNVNLKRDFFEKKTLKDLDFNKIEGQIELTLDIQIELMKVFKRDVEFLQSKKLMDYSLLLAVVKFEDIRSLGDQSEADTFKFDINQLIRRKSFIWDANFEFGYIIGIIDYFQQYTLTKFLEKYAKILINFSCNLDTSSQSSQVYAERFIKYVKAIFLDEKPFPDLNLSSY